MLLAPLALRAQVVLMSLNGITETPVGAAYNYGQVAAGDSKDVRFHARNTGTAAVTITNIKIIGTNFTIVNTSSTPFTVAPADIMAIFVRFSGTVITSYSATLQVTYRDSVQQSSTVSATLLATVVPAPVVIVGLPCVGPDSHATIHFGRIPQSTKVNCSLSVQNPNTQALLVSLTGAGFTASFGTTLTVAAGQTASATLTFTAALAASFSGTLTVGVRSFTLAGVGFSSPLPAPVWTFDASSFSSAEQHTLAIRFATASPVTASGTVTLNFASAITTVTDDSAIQFVATSKRVASFTVNAGDSALLLNGQQSIAFSTGTTPARITFAVNPRVYGITGSPTTTISMAPTSIVMTASSATRRASDLDVVVSGFDNAYSAGSMSFT